MSLESMINCGQPEKEPWETPSTISVYSLQYQGFGIYCMNKSTIPW